MPGFRSLLVWQKATALAQRIGPVSQRILRRNRRLADQLVRSAESVGANIAEGKGRATDRDFRHFVTIAIGSVTELDHHLQRALDSSLLTAAEHESLLIDVVEVRKMLFGLRKKLG